MEAEGAGGDDGGGGGSGFRLPYLAAVDSREEREGCYRSKSKRNPSFDRFCCWLLLRSPQQPKTKKNLSWEVFAGGGGDAGGAFAEMKTDVTLSTGEERD